LPVAEDLDFEAIAAKLDGKTGSDIAAVCSRASFLALSQAISTNERTMITQEMFDRAVQNLDSPVFEKES